MRGLQQPVNVPDEVKKHPDWNKNTKRFFGVQGGSDTQSEWDRNVKKFFDNETGEKVGDKFLNVQTNVEVLNKDSELYKKNAAKFFGQEFETKS